MHQRNRKTKVNPGSPKEIATDEALMARLAAGQLEACALLFERYHKAIFNFFLKQSGDRMLSEDLTQNVFERVLKYAHSYREGKTFRSWLYQIARNVYHNQFTPKNRFQRDFTEAENINPESPDQGSTLEAQEQSHLLQKALHHLSEDQRTIIILTKWQQLKLKEVAEILDLSESAARVRLHRAIKALRQVYFKMDKL